MRVCAGEERHRKPKPKLTGTAIWDLSDLGSGRGTEIEHVVLWFRRENQSGEHAHLGP